MANSESQKEQDDINNIELVASLPKENGWTSSHLYFFQGFWMYPRFIQPILSVQQHFKAHHTDIILATMPKSGTTWLKALMFSIANRKCHSTVSPQHPLLTTNPHGLVRFLEQDLYWDKDHLPDLMSNYKSPPRLFATHIPCHALPESIKNSGCRVIYLCRNPHDTLISSWKFLAKFRPSTLEPLSLPKAADMFSRGVIGYGPYWDHVLGYWKESLERPLEVLFLMYEDLKEDTILHVKRLAEFMGFPFSLEEERDGVVEEISRLCSFSNLKELEVNKTGQYQGYDNKILFRRGEVGDWVNHLTPEMAECLSMVSEEKFGGSGLTFKTGS